MQALVNVSTASPNAPVTPLLLLRDTAADTLSTFGDIFIDPRSDLWLNGPLVFITEEGKTSVQMKGLDRKSLLRAQIQLSEACAESQGKLAKI